MKKTLLTVAAALALVGCSNDDLMTGVENRTDGAIGVKAYVPTITRGTALNSEGDLVKAENGFELYAFLSGKADKFMDGVAFVGEGEGSYTWDYEDQKKKRFWSEAGGLDVTFYAVSPKSDKVDASALTKNIASDAQTLTYTVPTECDKQVDLMYAKTDALPSTEGDHIKNGITLPFHHALSQIVFKAKTTSGLVYADIEKVEITNLYGSGTFDMAKGQAYHDDKTTAEFPWEHTGEANSTFAAQLGNASDAAVTVNTAFEDGVESVTTTTGGNYDDGKLTASPEALLLLPQNLQDNGSTFEIKCKVRYKSDYAENAETGIYIVGSETDAAIISVPVVTKWEPGYKYTYTLIFSADMGNPIKVQTVKVDEWNNATDDVDINKDGHVVPESTLELNDNGLPAEGFSFKGGTASVVLTDALTDVPTVSYSLDGDTWYTDKSEVSMDWVTIEQQTDASGIAAQSADNQFKFNVTVSEQESKTQEGLTYENILKRNFEKGSADAPWDLSMHDIYGVPSKQNTANCYVVNASGYYKFPVKYGNAVKNGAANSKAFENAMCEQVLIWSTGTSLTASSAEVLWSTADELITNVNVSDGYVTFQVSEDKLKEGNAVIAVKNGSEITWSWHIWVTPTDLRPVTLNATISAQAMPVNVGWCSDGTSTTTMTYWQGRSGYVRFTQGEKTVNITVEQNGYWTAEASLNGSEPYYQFGRKDPFVINKFMTSADSGIQDAIKNPTVFYTDDDNITPTWDNYLTSNKDLWDSGANSSNNTNPRDVTDKTIFDPCPPGFAVAPANAYANIPTGTATESGYTITVGGRNIYIPASSFLQSDGTKYTSSSYGRCWASTWKGSFIYGLSYDTSEKKCELYEYMQKCPAYPVRAVAQ